MNKLQIAQFDLENEYTSLSNVCDNFAEVMEEYLTMLERFKPDRHIVHSPVFKDPIVQIKRGSEDQLSTEQLFAVAKLCLSSSPDVVETSSCLLLLDHAQKLGKTRDTTTFTNFINICFITPHLNVCEYLSSLVRYAIGERLHGFSTENIDVFTKNIDTQMFSHCNVYF